jgi:hypothetical protein
VLSNSCDCSLDLLTLFSAFVMMLLIMMHDMTIYQKDGVRKRVTIPLTRLPAVLGRSHNTGDVNFFSLGPAKALSRQHCIIDYRDEAGGKLVTPKSAPRDSEEEGKLEYERGKPVIAVNSENNENEAKKSAFPSHGAFVLEALGKNLIMVGR